MPGLPENFLLNEPVLEGMFGTQAKDVMVELGKPVAINPAINGLIQGVDFSLINPRAQKWLEKYTSK